MTERESGLGVWELVHEARFWHGEFGGGCTPDEELARKYLLRAAALLRSEPVRPDVLRIGEPVGEHDGQVP